MLAGAIFCGAMAVILLPSGVTRVEAVIYGWTGTQVGQMLGAVLWYLEYKIKGR